MQLPIHIASSSGNKSLLKRVIDSVSPQTLEIKNNHGNTPLMLAVLCNSSDCVTLLLKAGVHVDNSDYIGQTALHVAMRKGFHRCIKLLLSYNATYHLKDFSGVTPLHLAAINPNSKCLLTILKILKPGETDVQDISQKTALHWCAAYVMVDHIKMLLLKGANICIPDEQGKTPLHWAALNPSVHALECVKVLLEEEGSLINWQDYEGRSALHLAVATGTPEVVRFLVSKEACNTDILDNVFCTPLHWAAKRGFSDKADILLKKSIDTSADGCGATPLHYAAFHNRTKTVQTFLSRAYITDVGDSLGRNAIFWAAAERSDDVLEVMAKNEVDFSWTDKNGLTALHVAALQGHLSTIELLIKYNISIDFKDKSGLTALLRACQFGRAKATQLLLDLGADINITDMNFRSVLHWCAIGGHAYLCQILLQKGIACNVQDSFGRTPLHYACMKTGFLNCVSVLLESAADPNIMDNEDNLPLHFAILSNHGEIVKLLCHYDSDVNATIFNYDYYDWMTPLDVAIIKGNSKILNSLKSSGGLTFFEVKNIAAKRIQIWYRNKKFVKYILSISKILHRNIIALTEKKPYLTDEDLKRAAITIQRTWRRYSMKKKFMNMQTTIYKTFRTVEKRVYAEKEWCIKLQSFINEW